MRGKDFEMCIKLLGLSKTDVAKKVEAHRTTITTRCGEDVVPMQWHYIMMGLLYEHQLNDKKEKHRMEDIINNINNSKM